MESVYTWLASEMCTVCSDRIFDCGYALYDIYDILHNEDIDYDTLVEVVEHQYPGRIGKGTCRIKPENLEALEQAYERFTEVENKPSFEDVLTLNCYFVLGYLHSSQPLKMWSKERLCWTYKK